MLNQPGERDQWDELVLGFDRPSVIGAHLSPIAEQVAEFGSRLEQGVEFIDDDLDHMGYQSQDRELARLKVLDVVAKVKTAQQLLVEAQNTIVDVFPT